MAAFMTNNVDFHLLVAEDDETLRNLIARDLRRQGYHVHTAQNAYEALDLLDQYPIDLIISDIRMPNGDGFELLARVRARHPLWPGVIFVTGHTDVPFLECKARGALEVITKPFDRQNFLKTINGTLQKLNQAQWQREYSLAKAQSPGSLSS